MPTKESILENVSEYNADELVKYIKAGIVTFEELCNDTEGEFAPAVRREVKRLLEYGDSDEWERAQKERTVEAVLRYLRMYPDGNFRSQARNLKATLEQEAAKRATQNTVASAWNAVNKNSMEDLNDFVSKYPDCIYVQEANQILNKLWLDDIMGIGADTLVKKIREIQTSSSFIGGLAEKNDKIINEITSYISEKKITKKDFLEKLSEDHNLLSAGVVKRLVNSGIISLSDLVSIQIDKPFIQKMLNGSRLDDYSVNRDLDKIHKQSTEIYFWGLPSSGKSCALGAILSVASNGTIATMVDDADSQGYGYMKFLINHFPQNEVGTLIGSTPTEAFYEMGFELTDNENKRHPITCIDMAGELMKCMFKSYAGMPLERNEPKMLETMKNILIDNKSINRKMHFFVIEYGAEDKLYDGYPQKNYLDGAVSYIKKSGIFKKDTDAIYIMITKVDKIKNVTKETLEKYINDNYLGFYKGLNQICQDYEINGKKVEKIAFSLGEVCFQDYCRFDSRPAENVVKLILSRSASYRGGLRGLIEKKLRG